MGNLLKEEIAKGTTTGKIINDYVSKGDLVPTAIAIDTLCSAIKKAPTEVVLVDGFPRKEKHMKIFADVVFNESDKVDLVSVIEVRVSEDIARERVLVKESNKEDEELFNHQMAVYKDAIEHIEEFYNHDNLLKVINGERNIDVVIAEIDAFLKEKVALAPA